MSMSRELEKKQRKLIGGKDHTTPNPATTRSPQEHTRKIVYVGLQVLKHRQNISTQENARKNIYLGLQVLKHDGVVEVHVRGGEFLGHLLRRYLFRRQLHAFQLKMGKEAVEGGTRQPKNIVRRAGQDRMDASQPFLSRNLQEGHS